MHFLRVFHQLRYTIKKTTKVFEPKSIPYLTEGLKSSHILFCIVVGNTSVELTLRLSLTVFPDRKDNTDCPRSPARIWRRSTRRTAARCWSSRRGSQVYKLSFPGNRITARRVGRRVIGRRVWTRVRDRPLASVNVTVSPSYRFADMIQSNQRYSTKRPVRRRPVFVSTADAQKARTR